MPTDPNKITGHMYSLAKLESQLKADVLELEKSRHDVQIHKNRLLKRLKDLLQLLKQEKSQYLSAEVHHLISLVQAEDFRGYRPKDFDVYYKYVQVIVEGGGPLDSRLLPTASRIAAMARRKRAKILNGYFRYLCVEEAGVRYLIPHHRYKLIRQFSVDKKLHIKIKGRDLRLPSYRSHCESLGVGLHADPFLLIIEAPSQLFGLYGDSMQKNIFLPSRLLKHGLESMSEKSDSLQGRLRMRGQYYYLVNLD